MASLDLSKTKEESLGGQTRSASLPATVTGEQAEMHEAAAEAGPTQSDMKPKGPAICGVCEAAASKYKCSRCYLP